MRGDDLKKPIAHLDEMADVSSGYLAERYAECMLLGHVPTGEVFMTCPVTQTCYHCLSTYQERKSQAA